MNSISINESAKKTPEELNAYFEALQLSRATPTVRMFLSLGIAVSLLSFFHDLFLFDAHFQSIITIRVVLALLLTALLFMFSTPIKVLKLSLDTTVIMAITCVSVFLTTLYATFEPHYYIIPIKLGLCIFALVVIQMGIRLVILGGLLITFIPTILLAFSQANSEVIVSIFIFHTLWSGCSILAAHLFEQRNKRMFYFERQLYEINRMAVKAQEDESKANQEKSRFVANMSHEIRTPLTAIMGYAESILHDNHNFKDIKEALAIIHRNSQHLLSITNDVLDLSKVEAGKLKINPIPCSLFSIIDEVESLLVKQAEDNQVDFKVVIKFPLPEQTIVDPLRLRQILFNICSNAIKFSKGGRVRLELSANDNMKIIIFKVTDNGIGMDSQTVRNIFRPFSQGDISTTRRYGGTGLGLYIAYQLTRRMDGDIKVISETGQGSEFSVIMPLQLPMETIWLDSRPKDLVQRASKLDNIQPLTGHILVAEDQMDNQHLITILLKRMGLKVTTVDNGEKALKAALSDHFDLILMDMQMPVMDGFEATKLIKASGCDSPIIALSANVMKQDIESYQKIGCCESLTKPIDRFELYECLKHFLGSEDNPDNTTPKVDFSYDSQAMKKLAKEYLTRLAQDYQELSKSFNELHWQKITKPAHKIKGAAGNFNFHDISNVAADIEISVEDCKQAIKFSIEQLESLIKDANDGNSK